MENYIFATEEVQIAIHAQDREEAKRQLIERISRLESMDVLVPSAQEFELQYAY